MKNVLLIYPYFYTGMVQDKIFPPLGIGLLSALLKQKGIETLKIDCTFLTMQEVVAIAKEAKADITGIYVMTTLATNAIALIENLKEVNPNSLYVAGGPLPSLYPARFTEKFDLVFKGEAAISFPDFCYDYLSAAVYKEFLNTFDPRKYAGIYGNKYRLIDTEVYHLSNVEIDACPIPDRSGFDHAKYQDLCYHSTRQKKTSIMMTYGCPYSCDFCTKPIFGNLVRFRSMDRIFEEIKDIISYGYDSLWIADDLFTCDAHFLKEFCDRMIQADFRITWSCLSRVDTITYEIARQMEKSGCRKVYLGIESGNDDVLKLMNKKIDMSSVKHGVDIFKQTGIACAGFFIVGYPGETIGTIEETLAFALSLGLDEISFNVPYPLPGSNLYKKASGISDSDWTIENETRFLYASEFDEQWLKQRIRDTMEKFSIQKKMHKLHSNIL